jgi:dolichyl-diphosphooligosaccharide--protein glycosyltransferase
MLKRNNACYFLAVYGYIAWHFSLKMSRLVLICGPITAVMCAVWLGAVADFIIEPFLLLLGKARPEDSDSVTNGNGKAEKEAATPPSSKTAKGQEKQPAKAKKGKHQSKTSTKVTSETEWPLQEWDDEYRYGGMAQIKRKAKSNILNAIPDDFYDTFRDARKEYRHGSTGLYGRLALSVFLIFYFCFVSPFPRKAATFLAHSDMIARQMSDPTILKSEGRTADGKVKINDDPLKTYQWLATKTPKDSRVAAWWDYGYQITGIGRRTSLADGNTWNHEQIAMLGRLLSGTQKYSHSVLRHLADYVLIMTGGVNDDLGISTHFARIGNSAFPDHCGDDDPFCQKFTFYGGHDKPSPMMRKSLVYNWYMHEKSGVKANPNLFEEVYNSPRKEVRIFKVLNVSQESKAWVADPANKICDAPGSWYCVGQYPPAIKKFLDTRRSFSQVEDFNKKGEKSAYQKMIEKQRDSGKLGEL